MQDEFDLGPIPNVEIVSPLAVQKKGFLMFSETRAVARIARLANPLLPPRGDIE